MSQAQATISELRERIAQLEARKLRQRAYNQQEAAREVGLSVSKFREERKAGNVRGKLIGRNWVFTDEELQRYIAANDEA
jgi:hypothetical protein